MQATPIRAAAASFYPDIGWSSPATLWRGTNNMVCAPIYEIVRFGHEEFGLYHVLMPIPFVGIGGAN